MSMKRRFLAAGWHQEADVGGEKAVERGAWYGLDEWLSGKEMNYKKR